MARLLSAIFIFGGIGVNVWLMIHLMDVVRVVSAIQMAWGQAEGMVQALPWLPLFIGIPAAGIIGTIYMIEKYLKVNRKSGISGLVRFGCRVWAVQLIALFCGEALLLIFHPAARTVKEIAAVLVFLIIGMLLWRLPKSYWRCALGQRH